jgi:glucose/arabinose dehydrogenase
MNCKGVTSHKGKLKLRLQRLLKKVRIRALTDIAFAPGYPKMLFLTEQQSGKVLAWDRSKPSPTTLLYIQKQLSHGWEQGLLGLAFHPRFSSNRRMFLYYTDKKGTVQIVEYKVNVKTWKAELNTRRVLLSVPQPESNHNGGALRFGPDGFLYIGTGDGGSGGDPHGKYGNGQNTRNLLGKILRIDVDRRDAGKAYAIPQGNPFFDGRKGRKEIYHWGLRNPWRMSFDRKTGALWIGDVGQNKAEELDIAPKGRAGLNFGWRCREGRWVYRNDAPCRKKVLIDPVIHLPQTLLTQKKIRYCSIMAGVTYRGCKMPSLRGRHIYGDYCAQHFRWFRWDGKLARGDGILPGIKLRSLTSFATDHQGEIYITTSKGHVYKLVPAP